jgi:hypothetical protein
MFNLEQAIADWRRQLADAGIKSPDALDELESHLRDDIEQQARSGADPRVAFESAVLRVGQATELRDEFARSGEARGPFGRGFVRGACFTTAAFVFLIETWTLLEYDLGIFERLAGLCMVTLVTVYVASLPFLGKWLTCAAFARFMKGFVIASLYAPLFVTFALLSACNVVHFEPGFMPTFVAWLAFTAVSVTSFICLPGGDCGRDEGSGGPISPSSPGPQAIPPGRPRPPDFGIRVPPPDEFEMSARQSLAVAREEALRLGHDFIGTEHLLLGALKLATGTAATILRNSCVDSEAVRREMERLVVAQPAQASASALPLTPRARRALRLALKEARTRHDPLIHVEHIILGLLREGGGVAAQALKNLGVRVDRIRKEVSKLSGQSKPLCDDGS